MDISTFQEIDFSVKKQLLKIIPEDNAENIEKGHVLIQEVKQRILSGISAFVYDKSDAIYAYCQEMVAIESQITRLQEIAKQLKHTKDDLFRNYDKILNIKTDDKDSLPSILDSIINEKEKTENIFFFNAVIDTGKNAVVYLLDTKAVLVDPEQNIIIVHDNIENVYAYQKDSLYSFTLLINSQFYTINTTADTKASEAVYMLESMKKNTNNRKEMRKKEKRETLKTQMIKWNTNLKELLVFNKYDSVLEEYQKIEQKVQKYEEETKDKYTFQEILKTHREKIGKYLEHEMQRECTSFITLQKCANILFAFHVNALSLFLENKKHKMKQLQPVVAPSKEEFLAETFSFLFMFLTTTAKTTESVFLTNQKTPFLISWVYTQTEKVSYFFWRMFQTMSFSLQERCKGYSAFREKAAALTCQGFCIREKIFVAAVETEMDKCCKEAYLLVEQNAIQEESEKELPMAIDMLTERLDAVAQCGLVNILYGRIAICVSVYVDRLSKQREETDMQVLISICKKLFYTANETIPHMEEIFKIKYKKTYRLTRNVSRKCKKEFGSTADGIGKLFVTKNVPLDFCYNSQKDFTDTQTVSKWADEFLVELKAITDQFGNEKTKIGTSVVFELLEKMERIVGTEKYTFTHAGLSQMILDIHYIVLVCDLCITEKCNDKTNQILSKTIRTFVLRQNEIPKFNSAEWFDQRAHAIMESGKFKESIFSGQDG